MSVPNSQSYSSDGPDGPPAEHRGVAITRSHDPLSSKNPRNNKPYIVDHIYLPFLLRKRECVIIRRHTGIGRRLLGAWVVGCWVVGA